MTDEKLGKLFEAYAQHYWSVPVTYVVKKIAERHPDVTAKQVERVLDRCVRNLLRCHCYVVNEGVEDPELVTGHLLVIGDDFDAFVAARHDLPFHEWPEEGLLEPDTWLLGLPEARAILDFGKTVLGLDDEWSQQLLDQCVLYQPYALCSGASWVTEVLRAESSGKIHFRTLAQVRQFRDLGNKLYRVLPNPVLRGWKPDELADAPVLPDDIPERDEDIPDDRAAIDEIFDRYGGREHLAQFFSQQMTKMPPKKRKIGRNELCPCGSGLKFKKCKCEQYHPVR